MLPEEQVTEAREYSFELESASDFFGRFVVYHFDCL